MSASSAATLGACSLAPRYVYLFLPPPADCTQCLALQRARPRVFIASPGSACDILYCCSAFFRLCLPPPFFILLLAREFAQTSFSPIYALPFFFSPLSSLNFCFLTLVIRPEKYIFLTRSFVFTSADDKLISGRINAPDTLRVFHPWKFVVVVVVVCCREEEEEEKKKV